MDSPESERWQIVTRQAEDVARDGWTLIFDFRSHSSRAVETTEAVRLCVSGQASLEDWPEGDKGPHGRNGDDEGEPTERRVFRAPALGLR
jgi:hypothetical protein